jgi:hypothetical protein
MDGMGGPRLKDTGGACSRCAGDHNHVTVHAAIGVRHPSVETVFLHPGCGIGAGIGRQRCQPPIPVDALIAARPDPAGDGSLPSH